MQSSVLVAQWAIARDSGESRNGSQGSIRAFPTRHTYVTRTGNFGHFGIKLSLNPENDRAMTGDPRIAKPVNGQSSWPNIQYSSWTVW